jgi:hypothetical protein
MAQWNLYAAWIGILLGMLAGALQGLGFHREDWLGGYASWPRRLMRLGHVSFFGLAFINLAFAATARAAGWSAGAAPPATAVAASGLFLVGAALMPAVCYLSAWRAGWRRFFFLPVASLVAATACVLAGL